MLTIICVNGRVCRPPLTSIPTSAFCDKNAGERDVTGRWYAPWRIGDSVRFVFEETVEQFPLDRSQMAVDRRL